MAKAKKTDAQDASELQKIAAMSAEDMAIEILQLRKAIRASDEDFQKQNSAIQQLNAEIIELKDQCQKLKWRNDGLLESNNRFEQRARDERARAKKAEERLASFDTSFDGIREKLTDIYRSLDADPDRAKPGIGRAERYYRNDSGTPFEFPIGWGR